MDCELLIFMKRSLRVNKKPLKCDNFMLQAHRDASALGVILALSSSSVFSVHCHLRFRLGIPCQEPLFGFPLVAALASSATFRHLSHIVVVVVFYLHCHPCFKLPCQRQPSGYPPLVARNSTHSQQASRLSEAACALHVAM